ncbi:hypothetical protein [Streptomyces sp. NPDC048338]|uniref:hypothetical protein n=1 Tax=Streptomyces sp. NPDC048338 TaxID=3365536 RepID=UPI003716D16C
MEEPLDDRQRCLVVSAAEDGQDVGEEQGFEAVCPGCERLHHSIGKFVVRGGRADCVQRRLPHFVALAGERDADETLDGSLDVVLRQTVCVLDVADDIAQRSRRPASALFSSAQADSINAVRP